MHNFFLHLTWSRISPGGTRCPHCNTEITNSSEIPSICKPSILHPDANETPATHPKSHWLCIRLARLRNATTPVFNFWVSLCMVFESMHQKWKTTIWRIKWTKPSTGVTIPLNLVQYLREHLCYRFLPTRQTMPSEEFTFTTSAWSRRDRWMDWLLLV